MVPFPMTLSDDNLDLKVSIFLSESVKIRRYTYSDRVTKRVTVRVSRSTSVTDLTITRAVLAIAELLVNLQLCLCSM